MSEVALPRRLRQVITDWRYAEQRLREVTTGWRYAEEALEVLLAIFRSRVELLRAFPETVRGDIRALLSWAVLYELDEPVRSELEPYAYTYRFLLAQFLQHPELIRQSYSQLGEDE